MSGLFSQIGDMYKLQKEAKKLQNEMKEISVSGFSRNEEVEVVMDGTQEIIEIGIKDEIINTEKKEHMIKCIKEAVKDAQKKIQKQMMGSMDMSKIKNMLGG